MPDTLDALTAQWKQQLDAALKANTLDYKQLFSRSGALKILPDVPGFTKEHAKAAREEAIIQHMIYRSDDVKPSSATIAELASQAEVALLKKQLPSIPPILNRFFNKSSQISPSNKKQLPEDPLDVAGIFLESLHNQNHVCYDDAKAEYKRVYGSANFNEDLVGHLALRQKQAWARSIIIAAHNPLVQIIAKPVADKASALREYYNQSIEAYDRSDSYYNAQTARGEGQGLRFKIRDEDVQFSPSRDNDKKSDDKGSIIQDTADKLGALIPPATWQLPAPQHKQNGIG